MHPVSFAPPKTSLHTGVQEASRLFARWLQLQKLHPLLTTFGESFPCSGDALLTFALLLRKSCPLEPPKPRKMKSTSFSSFLMGGRNRVIVIAESQARFFAATGITSVRWQSYLPLKTQNLVLVDPAFVALRFESRDWRSLV